MAWSVCTSPLITTRVPDVLFSAALIYFGLMLYIVIGVLNERRPVWYYVISAILFVLSQLDYFLLSGVICQVRHPVLGIAVAVLHSVTVSRVHQ